MRLLLDLFLLFFGSSVGEKRVFYAFLEVLFVTDGVYDSLDAVTFTAQAHC